MLQKLKDAVKKKEKFPTVTPPRSADEINREYGQLCAQIGDAQYKIYSYTNQVSALNKRAKEVDAEAVKRNELDKAAEAEKAKSAGLVAEASKGAQ